MTTTAAEPTLEEQVLALKETAVRLAAEYAGLLDTNRQLQAERDVAFEMAGQATKDQERERRVLLARIKVRDNLISSVRIDRDDKHDEIRRLNARIRELALTNEDLQRRLDTAQQQPEAPASRQPNRLLRRVIDRLRRNHTTDKDRP